MFYSLENKRAISMGKYVIVLSWDFLLEYD